MLLCLPAILVGQGVWGVFWQGTKGPRFPLVVLCCVLAMLPVAVIAAFVLHVDGRRLRAWWRATAAC